MNRHLKALSAGVCSLALAGAGLLAMADSASAATTGNGGVAIAYQPDANDLGGLYFYNAAGKQITSGTINDTPMAKYYVSATTGTASAYVADSTPQTGNSATWSSTQQITSTQAQPATGLPGDLAGFTGAVVSDDSGASFNSNQITAFPQGSTTAGYQNLYEVRMYTGSDTLHWYAAEIQVIGTAWTQVFPNQTAPSVAVSSTTANPSTSGTAVQLTATLGTALAGKVQFFDGTTAIGTPQAVSGTTASYSDASPSVGTHHYNATFVPTPGTAGLQASNTAAYDQVVNAPAIATTTTFVSQSVGVYANDAATFTFHVSAADSSHPAGTVVFKDGATTLGNGTENGTTSDYTLSTSSLGQGNHQVSAQFLPTDPSVYASSNVAQGGAFSYSGSPTVGPADPQNIDAVVTPGIVTITTPYGPTKVFHLGNVVLDANGAYLVGQAAFPAATDSPITITDTRSGNLPWHAVVTSGDLTGTNNAANKINGEDLGFINPTVAYPAGNALTGKVAVSGTAAGAGFAPSDSGTAGLKGGPTFATTTNTGNPGSGGAGTAQVRGTLTLQAPSSTPADTYTGILTFTVIGS
jgi:hypothetical protein